MRKLGKSEGLINAKWEPEGTKLAHEVSFKYYWMANNSQAKQNQSKASKNV